MTSIRVIGVALSLNAALAGGALVTFEGFAPESYQEIHEDGVVVRGVFYIGGTHLCSPACPDNGTQILLAADYTRPTRVVREDGAPFTLVGFDLGEGHMGSPTSPTIRARATRIDGTQVVADFPLDGVNDGPGPLVDMQTYLGPEDFGNIVLLEFMEPGPAFYSQYTLDNISLGPALTAMDIPGLSPAGAVILAGLLGFAAILRLRRRRGSVA